MADSTVRVFGAKEVTAAFRQIDRKMGSQFGAELKKAAEPVMLTARGKVTRYAGASVNTIRTRRRGASVYVEQSARKVTGDRGDFGALQMLNVLMPALEEQSPEVFARVGHVLDKYAGESGF